MIGKIINEKYRVIEKLGSGGCGEVYKACHIYLQTQWALKFVSSDERFGNEPEVLKNLNHSSFPRLVDVIQEMDATILVYDYYEGPTMQKLIEQHGKIDEDKVFYWAEQILDALHYLHNHSKGPLIYRDLKPSNLIVLSDDSIKIIDFGAARYFKIRNPDDTVYLGTPGYAAPEQYGLGQTDERTDIYNFGMTLFHLLTGKHPLHCMGTQCEELLKEAGVSNPFAAVIIKCTSVDPSDRYHNTGELKKAFEATVHHQEITIPSRKATGRNAVEISISGVQRGVGVTHLCFLFGIWMQSHGFRTAVVEYGENRDVKDLCKLVEKESHVEKNGFFKIQGLSVFPSMDWEGIETFKRSNFDYILIDYGLFDEYVASMTRRSDVKLVVAPGADWKMGQMESFLHKQSGLFEDNNTHLLFPLQNKKSISIIRSCLNIQNIITVPFAINPWKQESEIKIEIEHLYKKMFHKNRSIAKRGKKEWHL